MTERRIRIDEDKLEQIRKAVSDIIFEEYDRGKVILSTRVIVELEKELLRK